MNKIIQIITLPFQYLLIMLFGIVKIYQQILSFLFEILSTFQYMSYKIKNKELHISSRLKHQPDQSLIKNQFQTDDGKFISLEMRKKIAISSIKFSMSTDKRQCISDLARFFDEGNYGNYELLINTLKKLDLNYGLNLYDSIITNLSIPSFIKSDIKLWEDIAFTISENDSRDEALYIELPSEGIIEDLSIESTQLRAFKKIALESNFSSSLKLRLLYENTRFKHGYGGSSKRFGGWVHMLHKDTNHFLSLATLLEKSIHKTKNNLDVELFTRQIFYCLVMAADTELSIRFSRPIKEFIKKENVIPPFDDRMSEFSKFLSGKHPPTLAGVGRALNVIKDEKFRPKTELSRLIHLFIENSYYLDSDRIFSGEFIDYLFRIGVLRGTIMHPSNLNEDDMFDAIDFLTNHNAKGHFYYHVGIDFV